MHSTGFYGHCMCAYGPQTHASKTPMLMKVKINKYFLKKKKQKKWERRELTRKGRKGQDRLHDNIYIWMQMQLWKPIITLSNKYMHVIFKDIKSNNVCEGQRENRTRWIRIASDSLVNKTTLKRKYRRSKIWKSKLQRNLESLETHWETLKQRLSAKASLPWQTMLTKQQQSYAYLFNPWC